MILRRFSDKATLGKAAAAQATSAIQRAIKERGQARIVTATGAAQFEFLEALTSTRDLDWSKIEAFHLDEYIGLPAGHPASFKKFLIDNLASKVGLSNFHYLDGGENPDETAREVGRKLVSVPIDITFLGIGENGHIAFNDPPADFDTEEPYLIVNLDEACRRQQVGEAWFTDISQVPKRAISMSARQILKGRELLAVVPDLRKARAVKACIEGEISPNAPASILRRHPNVTVYLDDNSASMLSSALQSELRSKALVTLTS
ncbi:MAG TPA: glucosamine-6-phosphate deaminase [Candidatus Solibacter sp.]|nr:glucosamine-6-phosphate deaminase [Candidatus Solibacter sp.]